MPTNPTPEPAPGPELPARRKLILKPGTSCFYIFDDAIGTYMAKTTGDCVESFEFAKELIEAWNTRALSAQLAALRSALAAVLASAHPHPVENPAMFAAFAEARRVLEQ